MIRVGIIGCGGIAENTHLPTYKRLRDVRIEALCDVNEAKAKRLSNEFRVTKVYKDSLDLLEREKIDIVDICTPGFTHYQECMNAISHDVNVLVEKPVALSLAHVKDINETSHARGVKVCVVHDYRFKEPFVKAMKMYQEGKIGQIKEVTGTQHGLSIFALPAWMWDEQKSGGILYELAVHIVDLQTWFCGEHEKIIAINKEFDEELKYTTDVQAMIEYKNGILGILDLAWFTSAPVFHFNLYGTAADIYARLFHERFNIVAGGPMNPLTGLLSEGRKVMKFSKNVLLGQMKKYDTYSFMNLLTDYLTAIKENREPPVSIDSVLNTMKLLDDLKNHISR